jgi:hypothetical protein
MGKFHCFYIDNPNNSIGHYQHLVDSLVKKKKHLVDSFGNGCNVTSVRNTDLQTSIKWDAAGSNTGRRLQAACQPAEQESTAEQMRGEDDWKQHRISQCRNTAPNQHFLLISAGNGYIPRTNSGDGRSLKRDKNNLLSSPPFPPASSQSRRLRGMSCTR